MFNKKCEHLVCNECGHAFEQGTGQEIKVYKLDAYGWYDVTEYYCRTHIKPFTKVFDRGYKRTYKKEMTVGIDGTPIGYKKIK